MTTTKTIPFDVVIPNADRTAIVKTIPIEVECVLDPAFGEFILTPESLEKVEQTQRDNMVLNGSKTVQKKSLPPQENKFHKGNGDDGKHYWLTPPDLMGELQAEFCFDFDPCPFPKPADFDGLTCEWGNSNYVNPPFGSIIHNGKKKGPTAWARKAIEENKKGKRVVLVYPIDKWVLMLLAAGAQVRNLGDVRWCATEDGSQGKGTGRHIAAFILGQPRNAIELGEYSDAKLESVMDTIANWMLAAGGTGESIQSTFEDEGWRIAGKIEAAKTKESQ